MSRLTSHLPGLFAAAMLVAHPPICFCSNAAHGQVCDDGAACCPRDAVRRSDGRIEPSHGPHRQPTEACGQDEIPYSAPCRCSLENLPTAVLASGVMPDTGDSVVPTRLSAAAVPTDAPSRSGAGLGRHNRVACSVTQALMISTGNPCALLSCWLC